MITQELWDRSFITVKRGQRKLLTSEEGWRVPHSLVLARELYTFSVGYYSKSKECLKVVKVLSDPLLNFKMTGLFKRFLRSRNIKQDTLLLYNP